MGLNAMGAWDVLLGREAALDEAEEALGKPTAEEAEDLHVHVARCAVRWAYSYRMSKANHAQGRVLIFLGLIIIVLMAPEKVAHWMGLL